MSGGVGAHGLDKLLVGGFVRYYAIIVRDGEGVRRGRKPGISWVVGS